MKVMVIGGGGREHAIVKKLRENTEITALYVLPGNGGMAREATCVPVGATDLTAITLCREQELPILCFALDRLEEAVECENVGTLIDSRP